MVGENFGTKKHLIFRFSIVQTRNAESGWIILFLTSMFNEKMDVLMLLQRSVYLMDPKQATFVANLQVFS
jgi:hypothetical protein